jgi:hypothetical protein
MRRHVFTLIVVLLPLSGVGCIALPMPGLLASKRTDTKNKFVGKIGDQNSSAPLRVGVSTRAEVRRVLGKAEERWPADDHIKKPGFTVTGTPNGQSSICFRSSMTDRSRPSTMVALSKSSSTRTVASPNSAFGNKTRPDSPN